MRTTAIALSLLVFLFSTAADSGEVIAELSGSGNATTQEFEVEAPWILDWRVNTDYPQSMAFEIHLVDASTGFQSGRILQTKRPGNGVRLFRQSGRFRFRISTTLAYWSLRVEQLSEQEAEEYTPR
jgi:hypothetical protein